MKIYLVISTVDGMEAVPYPTLKEAVEAWLENLNPCDAQRDLERAFDEDGPEAVLEMVREMDYEQTEYLWNEGEERVEVVDIEWAVDRNFHNRVTDKLERQVQDLIEEAPSDEERDILEAIERATGYHNHKLHTCLGAALEKASDLCGYSSHEYKAIDDLITYAANK